MSNYPMMFHKSTKFITDQGIRSFFDYNNGDKVNVYNRYGELEEGTIVIDQGIDTYNVNTFNIGGNNNLQPNGELDPAMFLTKKEILTTGGDLWLSYNGDYYESLSFGNALAVAPKNINNVLIDLKSPEWFVNGIIFAYGKDYIQYYTNGMYNNLRILAQGNYFIMTEEEYNENKIIFDQLKLHGVKYKDFDTYVPIKAYPDDYVIFIRGKQKRGELLKTHAWIKCPDYYKADAFEGYMYLKNNKEFDDGRILVTEYDNKVVEFIKDCSKFAGYHITNIKEVTVPTSVQTPAYKGSEHDHDEEDTVISNFKIYKKQVRYWEILLDPKYKRTNQRKYEFISRETVTYDKSINSCIVDTDSGSFILANGIIALSKPFEYIVK